MALPAHRAVQVRTVGNAHAPCFVASYGWTVQFGGGWHYLCTMLGGFWRDGWSSSRWSELLALHAMSVRVDGWSSSGPMALPEHHVVLVLMDGRSRFGVDGTARTQCRAGSSVMEGPIGGRWHCSHIVPWGSVGWIARFGANSMGLPACHVVRVRAD